MTPSTQPPNWVTQFKSMIDQLWLTSEGEEDTCPFCGGVTCEVECQ